MRSIAIGPRASSPRVGPGRAPGSGLRLTHDNTTPQVLAPRRLQSLPLGRIALLTGGEWLRKDAMLQLRCERRARLAAETVWVPPRSSAARVIDVIGGTLHDALGTLARVGLADATILPRPVARSIRGRAGSLAPCLACRAAAGASPPTWVLIDEFLTAVDRPTARAVATAVRVCGNRARASQGWWSPPRTLTVALPPARTASRPGPPGRTGTPSRTR